MKRLLTLLALLMGTLVVAQPTITQSVTDTVSVNVQLESADRLFRQAPLPDSLTKPGKVPFGADKLTAPYAPPKAKARIYPLPEEPLPRIASNLIRIGGGNYGTSYLEGFLSSNRQEKYAYDFEFKHANSAKGPVDGRNSGMGENRAKVDGWLFNNKGQSIHGEMGYSQNRLHYYGYADSLENVDADTIDQRWDRYWVGVGPLTVSYLQDRYNYGEWNAQLQNVGYTYTPASSNFGLRGELAAQYLNQQGPGRDRFLIPAGVFVVNDQLLTGLSLKVGVRVVYENDEVDNGPVHAYPVVDAKVQSADSALRLRVLFDGNMESGSLHRFSTENPWLAQGQSPVHSNVRTRFQVGGEVVLGKRFLFDVQAEHARIALLPTYINDTTDQAQYLLAFDPEVTTRIRLKGGLTGHWNDLFVRVSGTLTRYQMGSLDKPWHLPTGEINALFGYSLFEKLYLDTKISYLTGIVAPSSGGGEAELDPLIGFGVGAEARLWPRWSVFVRGENLLGLGNERWQHTPARGRQVIGGLSVSF